jgi:hypothetical protein
MLMNYHQLTMTESKDSYHRKMQFRVICAIIGGCFTYSIFISGILLTIEPFETTFPAGKFCYKQVTRDYAASMGIARLLRKEVLQTFSEEDDEAAGISVRERKQRIESKVYHVYLDNPENVDGGHTRWFSGLLVDNDADVVSYCDPLFEKNSEIQKEHELYKNIPDIEKTASELFEHAYYKSIELPPVKSIAIKFPFSDGFTSALVLSYKLIPELRQLAAEKGEAGNNPVIISNCSEAEGKCTFYVPLVKGSEFHAGLPPTEEHQEATAVPFSLIEALKGGARVVFPFLKPYIETAKTASLNDDKAEL